MVSSSTASNAPPFDGAAAEIIIGLAIAERRPVGLIVVVTTLGGGKNLGLVLSLDGGIGFGSGTVDEVGKVPPTGIDEPV